MNDLICSECGTQVPQGAKRCPKCGTPIIVGNSEFSPQKEKTIVNDLKGEEKQQEVAESTRENVIAENKPAETNLDECQNIENNPEANNNLIKCPDCNSLISKKAKTCPHCGHPFEKPSKPAERESHDKPEQPKANSPQNRTIIIILIVLIAIGLIAGGLIYYVNEYLPEQERLEALRLEQEREDNAPRYYTYATVLNMRSTPIAGVDYNKLGTLGYGTELITFNYGEWCEVRVNLNGVKTDGFVSSQYVMDEKDFFWLNSIWGNSDCLSVVGIARYRKALLDYFKSKGYVGDISKSDSDRYGIIAPTNSNQWQVFCEPSTKEYNTIYNKKRLIRCDSKYEDFAGCICY